MLSIAAETPAVWPAGRSPPRCRRRGVPTHRRSAAFEVGTLAWSSSYSSPRLALRSGSSGDDRYSRSCSWTPASGRGACRWREAYPSPQRTSVTGTGCEQRRGASLRREDSSEPRAGPARAKHTPLEFGHPDAAGPSIPIDGQQTISRATRSVRPAKPAGSSREPLPRRCPSARTATLLRPAPATLPPDGLPARALPPYP